MFNRELVKTESDFKKIKDLYIREPFKYSIYILTGKERLFKKAFITSIHSLLFKDEGDSEMNYSIFYVHCQVFAQRFIVLFSACRTGIFSLFFCKF